MTDFERLLKNLEKLIKETQDKLDDHTDEVKEEVQDNIREILEDDMDGDSVLMEYINDNFDVEIYEMDEYEFNAYCRDHDIRPYDALDLDINSGDCYFGTNSAGDLISGDLLSDFVDLEDVAKELVRDENKVSLGNDDIQKELERLNNNDECKEEFIKAVKELLGISEQDLPEPKKVDEDNKEEGR